MIALRVTRRPGGTEPDDEALPMPPEGLTIGRSDDCGLVLADPLRLVSRQHAQVVMAGEGAQLRCISSTSPLWVNGQQLDPGGERALQLGDRLRIGGFELAVEPLVTTTSAQRSRLDRWFDLDDAPDVLADGSALPALALTREAETGGAIVSWQQSPHLVRTGAPPVAPRGAAKPRPQDQALRSGAHVDSLPTEPTPLEPQALMPPAASPAPPLQPAMPASAHRPLAADDFSPAPTPAAALAPLHAPAPAPVPAPALTPTPTPTPAPTLRTAEAASELRELAAAFARGAGLNPEAATLTPAWMEHIGALLRASAEGTLALLQSRAIAKRQMRAEGTHITPRQNNPLKFSPDATEALTRMLQRGGSPGFLDPIAALHDAHHDLLVHQVAMVAGMRAAVFELFSRLGPEAAETGEGPAQGLSRVPVLRAAALWQRHRMQHAKLLEHLDDDFQTIFGREFLRAYEAQSRADTPSESRAEPRAESAPKEPPWPNAH
ncbi:type VI secretion system-associated FHA domain protein TagH [Variovorax sp. KK3]|uniref:type VI secretion system-associated FHA domain protein TagH n=1 Tax=Variovorax sp. KK3 TaxID=1855728 RepID=UPI00097BE149|nr:type VI secretion system-associated FHA domain protein TagH [Variovorax sp. KK3]